jgi:hypothetical protein
MASDQPASGTTPVDGRLVVELLTYKGAWVSRQPGAGESGEIFFVRKSSMRNQSEWTSLRAGSHVSFTIKRAAGRGIVSDAVIVR